MSHTIAIKTPSAQPCLADPGRHPAHADEAIRQTSSSPMPPPTFSKLIAAASNSLYTNPFVMRRLSLRQPPSCLPVRSGDPPSDVYPENTQACAFTTMFAETYIRNTTHTSTDSANLAGAELTIPFAERHRVCHD